MHGARYSPAGVCSSEAIGRWPSLLKILKRLRYAGAAGAVSGTPKLGREGGRGRAAGWVAKTQTGSQQPPVKKRASSSCGLHIGCQLTAVGG